MSQSLRLTRIHRPTSLSQAASREPLTVALALVKNEGDIISAWISHVCSLFDVAFVVDYSSSDGTREFLTDFAGTRENIHLFGFDEPGYSQEEIVNSLAATAASECRELLDVSAGRG